MAKPTNTLNLPIKTTTAGPVECLGQTFANDEARRTHFTELLRAKLKDAEFRKTPGFPKGADEDILAMSDPPYYTACPNPFLGLVCGTSSSKGVPTRTPIAADSLGSKRDALYNLHFYHTKVPPEVIERYIEHYTEPGAVVLDMFGGSGMTGVAATAVGRNAILADLSPAATFISNLTNHREKKRLLRVCSEALDDAREEWGWLYRPSHGEEIGFCVWSDVWSCSNCAVAINAYDATIDYEAQETRSEIACPSCRAELKTAQLERRTQAVATGGGVRSVAQSELSLVSLKGRGNRRSPNSSDRALLERVASAAAHSLATDFLSLTLWEGYNTSQPRRTHGVFQVRDLFSTRNLLAMQAIILATRRRATGVDAAAAAALLTSFADNHASRRNRFLVDRNHPMGTTCGILSNTLFIPPLQSEVNVFEKMRDKLKKLAQVDDVRGESKVFISTSSAERVGVPARTIDYVFVDPPFGQNIIYSDVNIVTEAFLSIVTEKGNEAIVNPAEGKTLGHYQEAMSAAFAEAYRVLKPRGWVTVVFSNARSSVWNALQIALTKAGFVVADVRALNKGGGTIYQDTFEATAKQDLVVSAYRPSESVEQGLTTGSVSSVWPFVDEVLGSVPVFSTSEGGSMQIIPKRTPSRLFDQVVAWFVGRGVAVPIGLPEFLQALSARYRVKDGMCFLPEQVAQYDVARALAPKVEQLGLWVTDEHSAINWLRAALRRAPQTQQELLPAFMKQAEAWSRHERSIDLRTLLSDNFLLHDRGPLDGSWYVPDPENEADLAKLRHRGLLREFESYSTSTKGQLRVVRLEALRAGFKAAYDSRDWRAIVEIAARLPEAVVEDDEKLAMYVDVAQTRFQSAEQPKLL